MSTLMASLMSAHTRPTLLQRIHQRIRSWLYGPYADVHFA